MNQLLLIFVISCSFLDLKANSGKELFVIDRSRDADQIHYQLQLDQFGHLDTSQPIIVYWLRKTKNNNKEPLTWVQQNFSYGINFLEISNESVLFQFEGYSKRTFELKKNSSGIYKVHTISQGSEIEISRVYIQINGGTFWFPNIPRVELYGIHSEDKSETLEIIHPN